MRKIWFAGRGFVFHFFPCLVILSGKLTAQSVEDESGRNLVVLVDRSKSVEPVNLKHAISLVSGMAVGEVSPESRQFWRASHADTPAGKKLMRIFEGKGGFLASETPNLLLASVGNYQRTTELRKLISDASQQDDKVDRKSVGGKLMEHANTSMAGEDLSTHLTLAFSIVFGESERLAPCYLVVISDFNEDCFNSPISDYDGGVAQEALRKKNEDVFGGRTDFKDGDGENRVSGRYDRRDIEDVAHFKNRFSDRPAEMEFLYQEKVGAKHTPLRIKIYSTDPVRSVRFKKESYQWVLPGRPPEIELEIEGIRRVVLSCGEWTESMNAGKGFSISEKHLKQMLNKGKKELPLNLGLLVESSEDRLEPVRSLARIQVESAKIHGEGPFAESADNKGSVLALPDESTSQNPKSVTQFEFRGKLVPSVQCKLDALLRRSLKANGKALEIGSLDSINVEKDGSFSFTLADFADEKGTLKGITGDENEVLEIEVFLPESDSSEEVLDSFVYRFSLPSLKIFWPFGNESSKVMDGFDRITLSASHAGIPGFDWLDSKSSIKPSGPRFRNGDIDFSGVSPGTYEITAVFGNHDEREVSRRFTVEVPKKSPWFLYGLGALGTASIVLFSYHFVKSRR